MTTYSTLVQNFLWRGKEKVICMKFNPDMKLNEVYQYVFVKILKQIRWIAQQIKNEIGLSKDIQLQLTSYVSDQVRWEFFIKMQEFFFQICEIFWKSSLVSEQRAWQGGGSDDRGIVRPSSTLGIVEKRTKSGVMSRPFSWAWLGR